MSHTYKIKEIFYTIQGEGAQTGRPAIFVRFSGCNLWSGREEDRANAICKFCDTDFRDTNGERGGRYTTDEIIGIVLSLWGKRSGNPFIVMTGGEPLLQLDQEFVDSLHVSGIEIAIETNGTIIAPKGIDWICVSPKAGTEIVQRSGNELKIVYPQKDLDPLEFRDWDFEVFSIQPMYSNRLAENTQASIDFCMQHPQWTLSLQTHKMLGLP
ncbi:MAG TPA: 7-carboxy-7-deazaguanine synthase [Saprospiraceae bacterium]|nr:7-carboxy-7-deazaguanine synthase [Saprospiraceae bacterium]